MPTYFTKDHEWISVDGDTATVGISNHAQEALGDIVFAEVPEAGRQVSKGQEAAVVESVKAASDVYAPVSGEVTEGNPAIADDPQVTGRADHAWVAMGALDALGASGSGVERGSPARKRRISGASRSG